LPFFAAVSLLSSSLFDSQLVLSTVANTRPLFSAEMLDP
jgi:hypothetical protein